MRIGSPPAWQRVLPGPSGLEPQKSLRKGVLGPPAPGSSRVPEECAPEPEKSPKRVRSCVFVLGSFRTPGALFGGLRGSPGPEAQGHPFGSFRTLLGFRARRAREHSVPGQGVPNLRVLLKQFVHETLSMHFHQNAPKERRRRRAAAKRCFWRVRFLLCPLKVCS